MAGNDYKKAREASLRMAVDEGLMTRAEYQKALKVPPPDADSALLGLAIDLANAPPVMAWPEDVLTHYARTVGLFMTVARDTMKARASGFAGTADQIERLQDLTYASLEGFVLTGRAVVGVHELATPLVLEFTRPRDGRPALTASSGPVEDVYVLILAGLLISDAGARLRRCADPKCTRFFLRVGKMEHCSRRCARRVYMATWRNN